MLSQQAQSKKAKRQAGRSVDFPPACTLPLAALDRNLQKAAKRARLRVFP
jgi:hypothetical protein